MLVLANLFENQFVFCKFVWNLDRIALVLHLLIALFGLCTGFQFDYVFDWTILKYQQSQLATPARAIVSDILVVFLSALNAFCNARFC